MSDYKEMKVDTNVGTCDLCFCAVDEYHATYYDDCVELGIGGWCEVTIYRCRRCKHEEFAD